MDPYLEAAKLWPDFHQHLVAMLYQTLLPGLADRYRARVQTRHYVHEVALFTSVTYDQHREPYIEIRSRSSGKLVTLLDVVSPGNRTNEIGRRCYLTTRSEAQHEGANLVEIDLVLSGRPAVEYDFALPADAAFVVTVTRAAQPDRPEFYPIGLDKSLPRFRLPLADDHQDTLVDLQTIFVRAFEQGSFREKVDYSVDPSAPICDESYEWLHDLLKQSGLR